MAATVRIGTCSWADEALSKWFYPPKLPAKERLGWYAQHFDTVEVDSTYYRLPAESMVEGWAERTPDAFTMHVKAFGLMTRHPVRAETIPEDLRAELPVDERGRVDRPPRELRGEVFRRFLAALEPLRSAGKLGGILFQLPPYIVFKPASLDYLEWAREQLGPDEMLVEFRHRSWLDDENRAESLAFLERIGAGYVTVDAPRSETARNLVPTVVATTSPTAYVRFHGRNLGTWNKRGGSAAERFDYLEWAREQLPGDEMLVEFRHRSWLDDENCAESLAFLERIGAAYVTVDAPRSETARNLVPTVVATTSPTAYVRFHGRNLGTWNKRGGSAAERFDYLYSDEELGEWIGPLRELAGGSEQAFAFFNNNASSEDPANPLGRVSQAATNARQLRLLLDANGTRP